MKKLDCFKKCFALVLFLALFSVTVQAETPVESSIESRLYLTFQVQESALQGLLPEPWQVNAISTGPSKGGNLTVIFVQALVCETPEGKPAPSGGTARYVVLTVPAKNALTGEESVFVTRIYTTDSERVPGHYKNAVKAMPFPTASPTVPLPNVWHGFNVASAVATSINVMLLLPDKNIA